MIEYKIRELDGGGVGVSRYDSGLDKWVGVCLHPVRNEEIDVESLKKKLEHLIKELKKGE